MDGCSMKKFAFLSHQGNTRVSDQVHVLLPFCSPSPNVLLHLRIPRCFSDFSPSAEFPSPRGITWLKCCRQGQPQPQQWQGYQLPPCLHQGRQGGFCSFQPIPGCLSWGDTAEHPRALLSINSSFKDFTDRNSF